MLDPYWFGSVGVQVTLPDDPIDCIAPSVQGPATRSCTWLEFTCVAPIEPGMILPAPTEFDLSLALPTEKFCSWALPTLCTGRWMAA